MPFRLLLTFLFICPPVIAVAQQAESGEPDAATGYLSDRDLYDLQSELDDAQRFRYEGVDHYKVIRSLEGVKGFLPIQEYYRVEIVDAGEDQERHYIPVQIDPAEITRIEAQMAFGDVSPEQLADAFESAGWATLGVGVALDSSGESASAGLLANTSSNGEALGSDIWPFICDAGIDAIKGEYTTSTLSAAAWMAGPACYYNRLSQIFREPGQDTRAEAREIANAFTEIPDAVSVVAREEVAGRPAIHLRVDNLEMTQPIEGGDATFTTMSIWFDSEEYVRLKQRLEGVVTVDGQERDFFTETSFHDFRHVPGSNMYEPYRQVLRTGGMLTPEQEAELRKAQAEIDKLEQQLEQMPAAQRNMMEGMLGNQIQQMRSLASGGAVEFEITTEQIEVNPEHFGFGPAPGSPGGGVLIVDDESAMTQDIQKNLVRLGYEPGNTEGVMDVMTQVAISQFQAENGMAVTGEPSKALADTLAAAVAGL